MPNQTAETRTTRRTLLKALSSTAAFAGVGSVLAQPSDSARDDSTGSTPSLSGWTSVYGGPGNTNYAPTAAGPKSGVSRRWVADPEPEHDRDYTTPVVHDGTAYVGARNLYAMDVTTGDVRWSFSAEAPCVHTPATDGKMIYVGTGHRSNSRGRVYAIDSESGTEQWRFTRTPPENVNETRRLEYVAMTVGDGQVFALGRSGLDEDLLVALDAETGERLWCTEIGGRWSVRYTSEAAPVATADGTVVARANGTIKAYDGETGDVVWTFDGAIFPRTAYLPLAIGDGTVYTSATTGRNDDYKLLALDLADGSIQWTYKPDTNENLQWSAPTVDSESVYVNYTPQSNLGGPGAETVAISRADGTLQYEGARLGTVADDVVYKEDAAYDAADGSKLFDYGVTGNEYGITGGYPALYGDGLFFGGDRVFVLEPGQGEATLPEPQPSTEPNEPAEAPTRDTETPEDDDPVCEP
ncbi:outer membrane protein assembly factor BamB family protein [Haloarcula amylovorans]|uniref:outer membrane protein assembly factor BamB family protein n=1 Tax=Haloarcula amylovorans TaxID=2562280 RepID=UPI0014308D10|nr:PQQ-binding-like beta-propeller repeat protein [Halomicroarcula amylolytica]